MNDQELDILFEQSTQRQQTMAQINRRVMKTVRRDMRLKALRKWTKVLLVSFGLPLLIVAYLVLLSHGVELLPGRYLWVALLIPVATLLALCGKFLHDFSPSEL